MTAPSIKALGMCMDRGHEPVQAVIFESIVKTVAVPFELPPMERQKGKRYLMLCGRCGLAYWQVSR